ncbi:hypothetical protein GLOTRDRAFT_128942 [Gloeophyllum trabeum ATCC 11539]|uniref:RRM domain-containing protein n=1 Tax=Gloeophyllum trabeum (strain ATCC 11539 / FP-39264 / Madison 617) TaxID=670483 RepID=S7RSQ5_GLOTA|nr:uncharacterized protein GLOTRDRAFT_128942 [Gloeophyllum trabeum ATCC 11539]EPQ56074.1 hypothetical protein GLOTRDRAFT_128942 [Gloeophyllum trabeum ATCC 11539]
MFKASLQRQLRSLTCASARRSLVAARPRSAFLSQTPARSLSHTPVAAKSFGVSENKGQGDSDPSKTIYLGNLPYRATEDDIREAGQQFGPVKRVTMGRFLDTGKSKGYAHIEFETLDAAKAMMDAHRADPFYFGDRSARVDFAKPTTPREGRDDNGRREYSHGGRRDDGFGDR